MSNFTTKLDFLRQIKNYSGVTIYSFDITIPSADILTGFSNPIDLVPAQGVNKIIVPISIERQLIYNTTQYATNGNITLSIGSVAFYNIGSGFLFANANTFGFETNFDSIALTSELTNKPMTFSVDSGNPTAGDSDIRLFGTYKIIDIS